MSKHAGRDLARRDLAGRGPAGQRAPAREPIDGASAASQDAPVGNRWQLFVSAALLALWMLFLAWTAFYE